MNRRYILIMKISSNNIDCARIENDGFTEKTSRPGNEVALISKKQTLTEIITLITAGVICALAFPGTNYAFLAWFSIIPLFSIALTKTPARAWRCGFYWGLGWAMVSFFWIREIELFLPLPLSLYLALYPAFWAYCIPFIYKQIYIPNNIQLKGFEAIQRYKIEGHKKEILLITTLSAWWCVLEWVRSWLFTGFPWNNLSVTQWQNISIIQICEYTGTYGVSFIIVFTNLAVYHSYLSWKSGISTGKYKRSLSFMLGMMMLLINFFIGSQAIIKANNNDGRFPFTATVIQGDIPQSRSANIEQVHYAMKQYNKLTTEGLDKAELNSIRILSELKETRRTSTLNESSLLKGKPDIVIWPETAVPIPYNLSHPIGQQYRQIVLNLIDTYKTPFLIGTLDYESEKKGEINYNSVFLIDQQGKISDKYHKKHIVPFGEFVPFAESLPWLVDMIGMGRGLSRGTSVQPLVLKKNIKAGVSICFEDAFAYITRDQVRAGANMLLTVTNDAWYPKSDEPDQHLANSIFRAIETRRPYIRCGNNSGSCVINETGQIVDSISNMYQPKYDKFIPAPSIKEQGFATFTIAVQKKPQLTFYTRHGDLFVHLCLAIWTIVLSASIFKWRAKKEILLELFNNKVL